MIKHVVYHITFQSYTNYTRVGQEPDDKTVDGMMSEAPGPLNFTMFLTLFGEKLNGVLAIKVSLLYLCML